MSTNALTMEGVGAGASGVMLCDFRPLAQRPPRKRPAIALRGLLYLHDTEIDRRDSDLALANIGVSAQNLRSQGSASILIAPS
jgi:hypothetical protein